ncbi:MAG TPA: tetratricopeptide repeat protein [Terriglobia bacterium]|nr:tetratricopeptide repeat protein [Terriglobia bacterium]
MADPTSPPRLIRFGVFEVDLRTGEMRKHGLKIKLQEQPFQVLVMLLERPGEVVTREELHEKVWGLDTFVDLEHGLATAVKKIREALGDSADNPRFVETLARRGYRFIYPVEVGEHPRGAPALSETPREGRKGPPLPGRLAIPIGVFSLLAIVAVLLALNVAGLRDRLLTAVGARRAVPLQEIKSIAVLPLENLSGDPEQEYFADGMTDELITSLGKISALRVISRQSVMRYKGSKKPLPEIARELNVDAVVEGTVRRSGDRVRITANLLHAPSDRHLWAETYERNLGDALTLESEVARAIVHEIRVKLTPHEQTELARARPVNPEAYQAYLKGRYLGFETPERATVRKALPYFQQAIEKDPGFALAYCGLAQSYIDLADEIEMAPKEAFAKARVAALKSLEIDPRLAEVHATLGEINFRFDWNWGGAEKEFKRAIELNPSSATAHFRYGSFLTLMGRWEESFAERRRADELDPRAPGVSARMWNHYWFSRQYDKAIELGRQRVEMEPTNPFSHAELGWPYIQKAMYAEAVSEFEKAVTLDPGQLRLRADLGHIYAEAGRIAQARTILREFEERGKRGYADAFHVALIHIGLREKGKALQWLERAYEDHSPWMTLLKVDPWLDPLRSDPRYQDLLRRMNFPP